MDERSPTGRTRTRGGRLRDARHGAETPVGAVAVVPETTELRQEVRPLGRLLTVGVTPGPLGSPGPEDPCPRRTPVSRSVATPAGDALGPEGRVGSSRTPPTTSRARPRAFTSPGRAHGRGGRGVLPPVEDDHRDPRHSGTSWVSVRVEPGPPRSVGKERRATKERRRRVER